MIIKQIEIQRFGRFKAFSQTFSAGLNIINGKNESGKSTLQQAILMALFANPTQTRANQQWCMWGSDGWPLLHIWFEDGSGNDYELIKDFEAQSQKIVLPSGKTTQSRDIIAKTLNALLGTTSEKMFRSTVYVAHDALAEIEAGRTEISQSLESVVTGGDDATYSQKALRKLDRTIREARKGLTRHAKRPGALAQARHRRTELEQRLDQYREEIQTAERDNSDRAESSNRLAEIEAELHPIEHTLRDADRAHEIQARLADATQREQDLEKKLAEIEVAETELARATALLDSSAEVANVDAEKVSATISLGSRIATLREEKAQSEHLLARYEREKIEHAERMTAHKSAVEEYECQKAAYDQQVEQHKRDMATYDAAVREQQAVMTTHQQALSAYQAELDAYETAKQSHEAQQRAYETATASADSSPQQIQSSDQKDSRRTALFGAAALFGVVGIGLLFNNVIVGIVLLLLAAGCVGMALRQPSKVVTPITPTQKPLTVEPPPPFTLERPVAPAAFNNDAPAIEQPNRPNLSQPHPPAPPPAAPTAPTFDATRLASAEEQLSAELSSLNVASVSELERRYEQVMQARQKKNVVEERLRLLCGTSTKTEIVQARRDASRDRRDAQETLEESTLQRALQLDPVHYNRLKRQGTELREEQQALERKITGLDSVIGRSSVNREEMTRVEELLDATREQEMRLEENIAVLAMTQRVLTQARELTLERAREQLGPKTSAHLGSLTFGRYSQVEVTSDLAVTVHHPDLENHIVEPAQLSRGTRDQLYMAARLALVDMLYPNARPPLLLDDPFVNFDPQRRNAAVAMCEALGAERQLLLFTCSDQIVTNGHLVTL